MSGQFLGRRLYCICPDVKTFHDVILGGCLYCCPFVTRGDDEINTCFYCLFCLFYKRIAILPKKKVTGYLLT